MSRTSQNGMPTTRHFTIGGPNLPVVELWPWDHETFLDFSPNFNHL